MQKWTSRDIKAALSVEPVSESRVGKLQAILTVIKNGYPSQISQQFIAPLSSLDSLVMYNPPDMAGVWITKAVVLSTDSVDSQVVEGNGYSQSESLVGLIRDLTITLAVSSIGVFVDSLPFGSKQDTTNDAVKKIAASNGEFTPSKAKVSVRHIATRAESRLPSSVFNNNEGLQKVSAGGAVDIKQRNAISRAMCDQIRIYAMHQWWSEHAPAKAVTLEVEQLFSYYRKRCDQKLNNREERLLDISPAWGPQVFLAISIDKHGEGIAIGSGCGAGAHIAISNAVLDLRHNEAELFWLSQQSQLIENSSPGFREQSVSWFQKNITGRHSTLIDPTEKATREKFWPQRTFVRYIAKNAYAHGVNFFYSNISAKSAPLSIVKVLISPVKATRFC